MAINCYVTIGSDNVYPVLPIGRRRILIRDQRRQLNGTLRTAHRASKMEFTLALPDADQTTRGVWVGAAALNASVTYTDEFGDAYTCVVQELTDDLTRTTPSTEGGLGVTGDGFWDLTLVLEQV